MNQTKNHTHSHNCCGGGTIVSESKSGLYTCPMHPNVQATEPGSCPDCGMNLVPSENKS